MGIEAFGTLLCIQSASITQRMPMAQLRQEFRQALTEAGYQTKEELVALVQDVKRELADEHTVDSMETAG